MRRLRVLPRFLVGTLRGRLILGVAAVHAVMMALFVADLTQRQRALLLERQVEQATSVSGALAVSAAGWIAASDVSGLQELVEAQRQYPELEFAILADAGGCVYAASDRAVVGHYLHDLPAEPGFVVLSRTPALVDVLAPAYLGERHVGWARVGVGQASASAKLTALALGGAAYAAVAILVGTVIAWGLGRTITRRLYAVQETMNAVRGGDRHVRSALAGDDEAATIGREFNAMLDAVAERDAKLRDSEARYRGLLQGIQAAVVVHDASTRIVQSNLLAQSLLGLSEDQLLGRGAIDPAWHILRPDGSPLPSEELPVLRVLREGKPLRDVVLGIHRPATNDDIVALVNADPERDASGAITHVVITFVDITARQKVERALAERTRLAELSAELGHRLAGRGQLRAVLGGCAEVILRALDAALVRVWTCDAAGDALELQASAGLSTRLDGSRRRVPVGEATLGCIARARAPHVTNAAATDPAIRDPAWARREGLVAYAGHPLTVEDRLVGAMVVFSRRALSEVEVTSLATVANKLAVGIERKVAEEALRHSEERYRRIVETAHEGIWLIDAENRTTFANQQMASMLGYTVDEMRGASLMDFMDEDGRRIAAANVERRRKGIAEQHDFKFRRKDGSDLWVLIDTTPFFDDGGAYAGALGMVTDVTDRRRMEEQLRQSQKLEAVGRLAGGVAHDFNNVLTAILGDAEELAQGLGPSDPLRADALEIQAAARRAALLTRQLLAFGRKQHAQPRVMSLGETVGAMERMLRRLIGENIELSVSSAPGLGLVRADPGQIEQVIVNLAVNARDAMPKGGRLTLETANVQLGEADTRRHIDATPGDYVMLAVSDTGCGMTPEVQGHLFEPFYTTKGLGGGTGLGLSTVYGIVKQCSGTVWVYSEPGRGTTFKIYLPRVEALAEPGDRPAPPPAAERGSGTVLVVEDEPMVRAMAVRVLRGAGYEVIEAPDGEAAALLVAGELADRPIDLLVADVVMPRLGGPELAARLRERRPDLRVVLMSGYTDRALELQEQLDERTAFLGKPFTGAELARKVREVLDLDRSPPVGAA